MLTQTPEEKYNTYLLAQTRESFGRVAYTHKTHEKQADEFQRKYKIQQGWLIAFTTLGTASFLATILDIFLSVEIKTIIISITALLTTWLSLWTNTFNYSELADSHRDTAAELWDIRESYICLIVDLMGGLITAEDAQKRRDELQKECHTVYSKAPRSTAKSYEKAQDALKNKEELTFTPEEIDHLLPQQLRITEKGKELGN